MLFVLSLVRRGKERKVWEGIEKRRKETEEKLLWMTLIGVNWSLVVPWSRSNYLNLILVVVFVSIKKELVLASSFVLYK